MAEEKTPEVRHPMHRRRTLRGMVVSDSMDKTVVVRVDRQIKHRLYKKYMTRSSKFMAHDPKSEAKLGDIIVITESRPISKRKRWAVSKILRRGGLTAAEALGKVEEAGGNEQPTAAEGGSN